MEQEPKHYKSKVFEIMISGNDNFNHIFEALQNDYVVEFMKKDEDLPLIRLTPKTK